MPAEKKDRKSKETTQNRLTIELPDRFDNFLDYYEFWRKIWKKEKALRKKEYQRKYPERYKAKLKVREALEKGLITKPEKCSYCGNQGKIEAHHENYFEPLNISWLCSRCHYNVHGSDFRYYQMHKIRLNKKQWLCHHCCRINSIKYDKCRSCGTKRGSFKFKAK